MSFSSSKIMATLRNKWMLAAVSRETQENARNSRAQNTFAPGMTEEYITQVSEEIEGRATKNCPRNLSERSHVFWVLCQNLTNFVWIRRCGHAPEPFREHPGTMTSKTGNPLGIVLGMIPISKWSSLFVRPAIQLNQIRRKPLTVWPFFPSHLPLQYYFRNNFPATFVEKTWLP